MLSANVSSQVIYREQNLYLEQLARAFCNAKAVDLDKNLRAMLDE